MQYKSVKGFSGWAQLGLLLLFTGIGLVLAIDTFCDMGRSMTNVLGNALATAAVSKWEGALKD